MNLPGKKFLMLLLSVIDAQRSSFSTYTVIENRVVFKDIASVQSWAGQAIGVAAAKGIINGKAEGIFAPKDNVTRAEFAKLNVDTFGLSIGTSTETFDDVADGAWYQPYVAAAVKAGLINGRSAKMFDPNSNITRAELTVIAANAMKKLRGYADVSDMSATLAKFKDVSAIPSYAKGSIALLTAEGIIKGVTADTFAPMKFTTRAEAAVIIYNLFNLS